MTLEEAESALASDPAAIVFAGRDFDQIAAQFASDPPLNPYAPPTGRPVPATIISSVRQAAAQATSLAARLAIVKNGAAELAGILAQRVRDATAAEAFIVERNRRFAEQQRAHQAAQARRERAHRAFHPIFVGLRNRLDAAQAAVGEAATAADMAAAHDAFATDLDAAVRTMRDVGATILPKAA